MSWVEIATAAYCAVASLFTMNTLVEGDRTKLKWDFARVLGLVACNLWPLVVTALLFMMLQRRLRA